MSGYSLRDRERSLAIREELNMFQSEDIINNIKNKWSWWGRQQSVYALARTHRSHLFAVGVILSSTQSRVNVIPAPHHRGKIIQWYSLGGHP